MKAYAAHDRLSTNHGVNASTFETLLPAINCLWFLKITLSRQKLTYQALIEASTNSSLTDACPGKNLGKHSRVNIKVTKWIKLQGVMDFISSSKRPQTNHASGNSQRNVPFTNVWNLRQPIQIIAQAMRRLWRGAQSSSKVPRMQKNIKGAKHSQNSPCS